MPIVDNVEDGDLSEYTFYDTNGNGGSMTTSTTAKNGTYGLKLNVPDEARPQAVSTSGLPTYIQPGDNFDVWVRVSHDPSMVIRFGFFVQSNTGNPDSVFFNWYGGNQDLEIRERKNGSTNTLATNAGAWGGASGSYVKFHVNTGTNGSIDVTAPNGASVSATFDSTFFSGGGGISCFNYTYSGPQDAYWDYIGLTNGPASPSSPSAADSGNEAIDVSWNRPNERYIDEYHIYRATNSTVTTSDNRVGTVSSGKSTFTDTTADPGTTYYYEVFAVNTYTGATAGSGETGAASTTLNAPSVSLSYVADDELSLDVTDQSDYEDGYTVEISRDGGSFVTPNSGPGDLSAGSHTGLTYTPNSEQSYGSVVGVDSEFQLRVQAYQNDGTTSSWAVSNSYYTSPVPPGNPSVSRVDGNTVRLTATKESEDLTNFSFLQIQVREDTGSGYGPWQGIDTISNSEGSAVSGDWNTKGGSVTCEFNVGETYQGDFALKEDARYQFRLRDSQRTPSHSTYALYSDWVYADFGNDGNVYFEDDFEWLSDWDGAIGAYLVGAGPSDYDGKYGLRCLTNGHRGMTRSDWSLDNSTTIEASVWLFAQTGLARHGGAVFVDSSGNGYAAYAQPDNGVLDLWEISGGPTYSFDTKLNQASYTYTDTTWYKVLIRRTSAGDLTAELVDTSGTVVASTTATDTTYSPSIPGINAYHANTLLDLAAASDGAGNSYSDSFEQAWESLDLSDPKSGVKTAPSAESDQDLGVSGPDSGSQLIELQSNEYIDKNLGDLSGETDVLVKCKMAAGSMDTSNEIVGLEFYDGSAWQDLEKFGWEYNRQGWVEVGALVPSSYLSTDNRLRLDCIGGTGDYLVVDRIVVSDVLHEYTTPAASTNHTVDNTVEDELTSQWTDNATFETGHRVDHSESGATGYTASPDLAPNTESYTITGLEDGEEYDVNTRAFINQFRRGGYDATFFATDNSKTVTTWFPVPTSLTSPAHTATSVDLDWVDNADNEDGSRVFEARTSAIQSFEGGFGAWSPGAWTLSSTQAYDGTDSAYTGGGGGASMDASAITVPSTAMVVESYCYWNTLPGTNTQHINSYHESGVDWAGPHTVIDNSTKTLQWYEDSVGFTDSGYSPPTGEWVRFVTYIDVGNQHFTMMVVDSAGVHQPIRKAGFIARSSTFTSGDSRFLRWTDHSDMHLDYVTEFTTIAASPGANTSSATASGLLNGEEYRYSVAAYTEDMGVLDN